MNIEEKINTNRKIEEKVNEILKIEDENERINELIDYFMEEDSTFPIDKSSRILDINFPKDNHEALNLPGKYEKRAITEIVTIYNRPLRLDQATFVLPDEIISKRSILNTEYQAELPNREKKIDMFDYKHGMIYTYGLYCATVLVGNFGPNIEDEKIYEAREHKYNVFIRNITDDEIQKRLNMTINKIDNNEYLSTQEALNIAYVCIHASPNIAKSVIKKITVLFPKANINNTKLRTNIVHAIKNMVKHRFRDDEKTARRMLKMMIEALNEQELYEMPATSELEEQIRANKEFEQKMYEKIKEDNELITSLKETIKRKDETKKRDDETITSLKETIKRNDETMKNMQNKIKELEEKLDEKDKDDGNTS